MTHLEVLQQLWMKPVFEKISNSEKHLYHTVSYSNIWSINHVRLGSAILHPNVLD